MLADDLPGATLAELVRALPGAELLRGDRGARVRDVRHDSRAVSAGDVFVARRGARHDGATYAAQAAARGAAAVLSDRAGALAGELPAHVALVQVADTERAMAFAASCVWRDPTAALRVAGVTGTNGKTTTSWLVERALTALGHPCGLLGTVENRFGAQHWPALHTTPEADELARRAAAMRAAGATHLSMEVSSHALALARVAAVRFEVAALTYVGHDHLDFHGTFEAYADAKRQLFLAHAPRVSVLNVDDPVGRGLLARAPGALGYSLAGAPDAALRVLRRAPGPTGLRAEVATPAGTIALTAPLPGAHNLANTLTALGMLVGLGVAPRDAAEALARCDGPPGRLERVSTTAAGPAVFVDYAHTPDALANVLASVRENYPGARMIVVFGCGGDRDPSKRRPMGAAAGAAADVAVLTTDNPRGEEPAHIAAHAEPGLRDDARLAPLDAAHAAQAQARGYLVELDRRRAIALAVDIARPTDVVVIAGKGHETYQEVRGVRAHFDDREEARAALAARAARG